MSRNSTCSKRYGYSLCAGISDVKASCQTKQCQIFTILSLIYIETLTKIHKIVDTKVSSVISKRIKEDNHNHERQTRCHFKSANRAEISWRCLDLLPPANEVARKVMFSHVSVILFRGRGTMGLLSMMHWTPSRHGTSLYKPPPPTALFLWIWSLTVQGPTPALALITVQGPDPSSAEIWWLLKHVWLVQVGGRHPTGMLPCFLLSF